MHRVIQAVFRNLAPIFLLALLTFGLGVFARQAASSATNDHRSVEKWPGSIHQGDQIAVALHHAAAITEDSEDSQDREEREQKESSKEIDAVRGSDSKVCAQVLVENSQLQALALAFNNRALPSLIILFHSWKGYLN